MKNRLKIIWIITTTMVFVLGCSNNSSTSATPTIDLVKIEDALNHSNIDFVNLVNKTRGSVGTNGPGSKVIWSKKNEYNLGLFVSANHVYNISSWLNLNEDFIDIKTINNGLYAGSKIPPINGNPALTNELSANFALYHPDIPSNATNTTILPENDFYLGIIDNQKVVDNGFAVYPNLVQTSMPLQIFDPNNRTSSIQTWSTAESGKMVIAIGYPQDTDTYPNGAVSSGKVYSDAESENIIQSLQLNGDVEGDIPYNAQVEFLANSKAVAGMSGGGVFNDEGQLLGVMVRATELNGEPILRVVRMSYIIQKLKGFYNALSVADRSKIRPFISGELN
ncbi:MAG: serine protease [Flavobacterium sp. JAD_PAG50586_2]|nr:MAG: serine protease [Flavobacterium sp. JAD_PAG50586_2]